QLTWVWVTNICKADFGTVNYSIYSKFFFAKRIHRWVSPSMNLDINFVFYNEEAFNPLKLTLPCDKKK
ncbi:hypothetical protein K9M79_04615, partial [Candidatus Woesearchaeota archaeon]|nr:hypothetical protein [Candidatus Woesearchaeota archaeon]